MAQCEIAQRFFDMLQAIGAEQKTPRNYGTNQLMYHSEMDLLEKIYQYPDSNVSDLSGICSVTKSAITQSCNKLFEKGLIEKYSFEQNKKEKYFRLTSQGEEMRLAHQNYHRNAGNEIRRYLCSLQGEERRIILEFMGKMEEYLPTYAFPCLCGEGVCGCATETQESGGEAHACGLS